MEFKAGDFVICRWPERDPLLGNLLIKGRLYRVSRRDGPDFVALKGECGVFNVGFEVPFDSSCFEKVRGGLIEAVYAL